MSLSIMVDRIDCHLHAEFGHFGADEAPTVEAVAVGRAATRLTFQLTRAEAADLAALIDRAGRRVLAGLDLATAEAEAR